MERFDSIYPFTTENISGYMSSLDLSNKRVITVTGSGDHVINAIKAGSSEITTFDINPLSKNNLDLKLSGIKFLSYEDFLGCHINIINSHCNFTNCLSHI